MQDLRDSLPSSGTEPLPITGVCVVSDPGKVPTGYTVISKTSDGGDDADLWADRFFAKKVTRYICYTRAFPLDNGRLNNVVADMCLINDKDPPTVGYSLVDTTIDTGEKATNKKLICVLMSPRDNASRAVCDIIIHKKRPPSGYTMIGEINGLCLSFQKGDVPYDERRKQQQALPYQLNQSAPPIPSRLAPTRPQFNPTTLQRHYSVTSPLAGVPFEINSSLLSTSNGIYSNMLPPLTKKSLLDIEKEYNYSFQLELANKPQPVE